MSSPTLVPASDPEVRRSGIGSSDAAIVAGLNPWATPLDLYLEKTGLAEPDVSGEAAEWGTILEPVILRQFAIRRHVWVLGRWDDARPALFSPDGGVVAWPDGEAMLGTLRHPEHPFMMAHVDGFVIQWPEHIALRNGGSQPVFEQPVIVGQIEAKTTSAFRRKEWGEDESDEIPEEYVVQVQHSAEVVRAALGVSVPLFVPVLIGGQAWRIFELEHDAELVAGLVSLEREFWDRVQQREPPPATPDDLGKRALGRLFPSHVDEKEIIAPPDSEAAALAAALRQAREACSEAEGQKTAIENRLKELIGDAAALIGDGWRVTWRQTKDRASVDWQAVARALAADIAGGDEMLRRHVGAHTTTKPGARVFRPTWKN